MKRRCSICGDVAETRPVVTDEELVLHVCADCEGDE